MSDEEIISKLKALWVMTEQEDFKDNKHGNYEFELGKKVINLLKDKFNVDYKDATLEQKLMGIPIRINVVNPDAIHLWKEIK